MSIRQRLLKAIYPLSMAASKGTMGTIKLNDKHIAPHTSIYDLILQTNDGKEVRLSTYKGKKLLLVNTASNCGYTNQYEDLERLQVQMGEKLVIIAFPANDFKEQEKGSDADIAAFCQLNYGVTFPLAKKAGVVGGSRQPIFKWLSDSKANGWNDKQPQWNFCKYLVDEKGILVGYFGPAIAPLDKEILSQL